MFITIQDHATDPVKRFVDGLGHRRPLMARIARRAHSLVRRNTLTWARSHHATAQRLGAQPSNFVAGAAESIESTPPLSDNDTATIRLPHPFFARAFGAVTIAPKGGVYLTLPLLAQAYNQRAYRVKGLFFYRSKSGKAFLAEAVKAGGTKGTLVLWYLLLTSVRQSQDQTRLPTEEEFFEAAMAAVESYMQTLARLSTEQSAQLPDLANN